MIAHLNTISSVSGDSVRYFIAQHMPNPMRKEPRNVGVVVEKNGQVLAQFVGEPEPGKWEQNRLRSFSNANAYRLWVDHWRKLIAKGGADWPSKLLSSRSPSFALVEGGELTGTGTDSPNDLCHYLFGLIVGGGLADALAIEIEEQTGTLKNDVGSAFRQAGILGEGAAPHPVLTNQEVQGTAGRWHNIAFFQKAGNRAWAVEPIDFTVNQKRGPRDRAAYAKYVFDDLRSRGQSSGVEMNTVAIVRANAPDRDAIDVVKGLEILTGSCDIVDWFNIPDQRRFVGERTSVAFALAH